VAGRAGEPGNPPRHPLAEGSGARAAGVRIPAPKTDIIGENLFEVFSFLPEDKIRDEYRQVFETGKGVATEEEVRFGSTVFCVETRKLPIAEGGRVARVLTVIHDVTERKKAERELKCLADTAMALVAVAPDVDAYDFVCEHLGPLVGDAVFSVSTYDEERHTLTVRRVVGLSDEQLASVREQIGTDLVGMTFERIPVGVRDYLARGKLNKIEDGLCGALFHKVPEATSRALGEHFNIGAAWSVGLRRKGRLFGSITIFGPVGMELDGGAIETMANQVSIALERRLAEQELRDSEQRYRATTDTALDSIFTKDAERRYTSVNPAMEKLFGVPASALLGKTPEDLFDADSAEVIREVDRRALAGEVVSETRDLPFGGEVRTFHTIQVPLRDATGRIAGISGIVRDITEPKRAEQALRASEERFRNLVELSPDGIAVHQAGKIVMVNWAGARLMGYDEPEEMIGLPVMELVHPDDRQRVEERIRQALKEGQPVPLLEQRLRRKYGSYVWAETVGVPFEWAGRPAVQVIIRDVDMRRRLQEEVEKLTAHTRIMFENSPNGICAHSEGRVVFANSTFVRLLGYDTPDELIGREIAELVAPEEREQMARYKQGMLSGAGAPANYVFKALCRDGSVVELENTVISYKVMEQTFILNTVRPVSARGQPTIVDKP
jgi:PAS domain S-box-containing protein